MQGATTRKAFLRASGITFVGGSAMFVAACGGDGRPTTRAAAGVTGDLDILNQALDLENTTVAVYAAAVERLTGGRLALARKCLAHEREHAAGVEQAISQLRGTPHVPRKSYADVIGNPRSETDMLKLANVIENAAVQAYVGAIPRLRDPGLRATAAAILTNEAEHITLLRGALRLAPVPSAFVSGRGA